MKYPVKHVQERFTNAEENKYLFLLVKILHW